MKLLAILAFLFASHASFSCGNEYGYDYNGNRMFTQFFYLSDYYRKFDKAALEQSLAAAIAKRGQSTDDFKNESNIALYYMKLGQTKKALTILEPLAQKHPSEYTVLANLGTAYELDGQLDKALKFIRKGYELNTESHYGSEWIHIKILEAKIKAKSNPSILTDQPIITVADLKAHLEEDHEGSQPNFNRGEYHGGHMAIQIRTRLPFTPAPDKVIANLLKTYAAYAEEMETMENALMAHIYRLEFETSETRKLSIKRDIDGLIKRIRKSDKHRLSASFLDLIKTGEVDPSLLIYAADTLEFQLEAADFQRSAQLDSFEMLKHRVDSLENTEKSVNGKDKTTEGSDKGMFWGLLFGGIGTALGIGIALFAASRKR